MIDVVELRDLTVDDLQARAQRAEIDIGVVVQHQPGWQRAIALGHVPQRIATARDVNLRAGDAVVGEERGLELLMERAPLLFELCGRDAGKIQFQRASQRDA
jgi:hypothetical protein